MPAAAPPATMPPCYAAAGIAGQMIVHGRGYNFRGLTVPANVKMGDLVPAEQYLRLLLDASVEVVPL